MDQNNKVLFLGHDACRAGAPMLLLELIKWLAANSSIESSVLLKCGGELEHEYAAIATTRNLVEESDKYKKINRSFHRRIFRNLGFSMIEQPDLNKFYPIKSYPLIYANTIATCELAQQLSGQGRNLIHHIHELSYYADHAGVTELLKKAVPTTTAYIAASNAVQEFLEENIHVPADKIHLIHEFPIALCQDDANRQKNINIRRQFGIADGAFVVGMCGTADWRKGADIFVQLALQMKSQLEIGKCHFLWLGGNQRDHRMALHDIKRAGLLNVCHFILPIHNPEIYFNVFDIFALTSREDPFPVAMLEAASYGLPIVCFENSGGTPELVEKDAGIVVPYLDVPAMAKACIELLKNEDLRKQLGHNAKNKVKQRYALNIQCSKIHELIRASYPDLR